MNKVEILDNFAVNIEKERLRLGLTQQRMAKLLGVSLSSYKMLINCQTNKIDVCTLVRLYELTGKFAYEFLGIDDGKTRLVTRLNYLNEQQLSVVESVVDMIKT